MSTKIIYNFGAGPAKIPTEVMEKAHKEFRNYSGTGMSVMELSHRGSEFVSIVDKAENLLRQLLNIPNNYKVLFLHGGGLGQFSAVPMNLMGLKSNATADYIVTGYWSKSAAEEAAKYGTVNSILPKDNSYTSIDDQTKWNLNPNASYVFYCSNETIHGVEFPFVPETHGVPLVCDMSSNFLSQPIDIKKYGLIFAGAQKNLGCAGMSLVIVREDLLGHHMSHTPAIWVYQKQVSANSCLNTPPMYSIYILSLILDWIKENGGAKGMEMLNSSKARKLYQLIDNSHGFYVSPVAVRCRSKMNIPFRIGGPDGDKDLEERFLKEASKRGFLQLKGHRSVGGLRASLYNAITLEEVTRLVEFMDDFQHNNQQNGSSSE